MSDVKRVRGGLIRGHGKEKKRTSIKDFGYSNENNTKSVNIKKSSFQDLEAKVKEKENNDIILKEKVKSGKKERLSEEKVSRIRKRKLRRVNFNRQEQELDQEVENGDNFSISIMILILVVCFVVGIVLGYLLYRLAIDSSAIVMIGKSFLL